MVLKMVFESVKSAEAQFYGLRKGRRERGAKLTLDIRVTKTAEVTEVTLLVAYVWSPEKLKTRGNSRSVNPGGDERVKRGKDKEKTIPKQCQQPQ